MCHRMRSLPVLLTTVVVGAFLAACGGTGKGSGLASTASSKAVAARGTPATTPASTPASEPPGLRGLKGDEDDDDAPGNHTTDTSHDSDADFDNDSKVKQGKTYFDSDDGIVRDYGQAASAPDTRAITALVRRYYAAATAADGARVCSLMFSLLAEAIPEDYGRGAGPAFSRGNTCPVVLSKLYRHDHGMVAGVMVVTGARVNGKRGQALIGSKAMPASSLALKREYAVWKIDALLPHTLP
jgi:hypothetical protein